MAAINGTLILLEDNGTAFALTTSATLNVEMDLPDASSKQSSGWANHIQGQRSFSVDLDGLADFEVSGSVQVLIDHILDRTTVSIEFEPDAGFAGGTKGYSYQGSASVSSVSVVASNEDTATLSGSFVGTGALTKVIMS